MPNAVKTQRKHQTKNIILLLFCLLIAICSVLLIWGSSIPAENVFLGFGDTESFSGGWTDPTFRGFTYERNTYTIGKGQILTFDHAILFVLWKCLRADHHRNPFLGGHRIPACPDVFLPVALHDGRRQTLENPEKVLHHHR